MNATTLEARHYVATLQDIERLTKEYETARTLAASAGGTYLRALVATVQHDLGAQPRERTARGAEATKTTPEECARQLAAFEKTNELFYGVVLRGLSGDSLERNRKSGFARSAASALRRWVRSGHDVTRLAARSVTRDALEAAVPRDSKRPARLRVGVWKRRGERGVTGLVAAAVAADKSERGAGVALLESALSAITAELVKLGGVAVARSADVGVRERRPFSRGSDVFWPVGHVE